MHVVIGGCRDFCDYTIFCNRVDQILSSLENNKITILSGHCSGVDTMAEQYSEQHGFILELHPAEWKKYGRAAGPIRNRKMVERADLVIAFWDGLSKGTKSLIELAKINEKELRICYIKREK